MNNNDILKLIQKASDLGISRLEYQDDELTLVLKGRAIESVSSPVASDSPGSDAPERLDDRLFEITSTGCGYFQRQASRLDRSCESGTTFNAGQILGFVRVGRVLMPLRAPRDGQVLDVLVADGTRVDYGQPVLSCHRPDS